MSVVSDIEIRLRADIARLQQDMTQARQAVGGAMTHITNAVRGAATGLAALAAGLTVGAFAGWIKGAIDAVDAIGDISPATGVAVKDIAALQMAFQFGGLEAGDFEKTMIKLSGAIAAGDKSFARIGVNTRTATGGLRESKDVLYDVADAFADLQDGTAKTALATDIFGKSGAALIPMLNNGSEGLREMAEMADKLGLSFTEAGVEAAGKFNDSLDTLGLASQGVARQVAVELLPTLNSLLGSLVTLITEGNGVSKMAAVIGGGFKTIYTGAVAVGQAFDVMSSIIAISIGAVLDGFGTIGKTLKYFIEGEYSKAWQAATTGAEATVGNAKRLSDDMVRSWNASGKAIAGVWDGTSGEVVESMGAIIKAGKLAAEMTKEQEEAAKKAAAEAKKLADEQKRAAEKNAEAYASLLSSIEDRIDATKREAAGLTALTESQKLERDLDKQLAAGKLTLTAAQVDYYRALINTLGVQERLIESNKFLKESAAEQRKELAEGAAARNKAREEETEKQATEQRELWDSIDKTAHDTFVSIADGGKNAATRLKDTFKNIFFDWLYQQTLKKWIIQLQPAVAGGGGAGSALAAAAGGGGGGAGGALGMLGGLFGAGGLGGALSAGAGWVTGATSLGGAFSAGASLLGTGTFAGATSGAAMLAGAAAPILAAVAVGRALNKSISGGLEIKGLSGITNNLMVVGGILNRAFGRGPKETTATGITGTFGMDSFTGSQYSEWTQKGGWFKSNRRGTDTSPLAAEMAAALNDAYKGMKDSTSAFAEALGLPTAAVGAYSKQIKLAFTGDAAKDQQALVDVLAEVGDELATRVLPNIATFIKEGETAATTLQRLATEFVAVGAVMDALGAVGVSSIEARTRLVELSGGIEALATQYEFYNANFLSEAERIAPVQKAVAEQLATLGFAGITTTEQFKAAVQGLAQSGALATETGAKQYAGLMALAPAYKQVADYLAEMRRAAQELADAEAATAMEEAARAAEELARAQEAATRAAEEAARALEQQNVAAKQAMLDLLGSSFAGVQRAVGAQRDQLARAFDGTMREMQVSVDSLNSSISATRNLAQSLKQAVGGISVGGAAAQRASGQAQIAQALAVARATGVLPGPDDLRAAIAAVSADASNEFATFADYVRSTSRSVQDIEALGAIAGDQVSIQEQQLAAALSQQAAARMAHEAELARLDGIVMAAQAQVDAIRGVDNSVQSVVAAMAAFGGAVAGAKAPPVTTATGTTGLTVEELFRQTLGREGRSEGIAFWKNAFGSAVDASEIQQFLKGAAPELTAKANGTWDKFLADTAPSNSRRQSGTMDSGAAMLAELQTLNTRMANVEKSTGQFAQQFDSVSGGGNVVIMESA